MIKSRKEIHFYNVLLGMRQQERLVCKRDVPLDLMGQSLEVSDPGDVSGGRCETGAPSFLQSLGCDVWRVWT